MLPPPLAFLHALEVMEASGAGAKDLHVGPAHIAGVTQVTAPHEH